MTGMQKLFALLTIFEIGLLIVTSLKGTVYDGLKGNIEKKYSGNHSFSFNHGKFRFSIPRFINENTDNKPLINAARIYNIYSVFFWINIVILIFVYFIAY
jgi:hypothetical protein